MLGRLAIFAIRTYKYFRPVRLSGKCIYQPSCTEYAIQAIKLYGVFQGAKLTYSRIKRCNGSEESRYDPVPVGHKKKGNMKKGV